MSSRAASARPPQAGGELFARIAREAGGYALSMASGWATAFVKGVVSLAFLKPEELGVWASLSALLAYAQWASLGTLPAFSRDYPRLAASGKAEEAERLLAAEHSFAWLTSLIFAAGVLAASRLGGLPPSLSRGLRYYALVSLLSGGFEFYVIALRARLRMHAVSVLRAVYNVLSLALVAALLPVLGLEGAFLGTLAAYVPLTLAAWRLSGAGLELSFDPPSWGRLSRAGLPLLAMGLFSAFQSTVDRLVVGPLLGLRAVGLFATSQQVPNTLQSLPIAATYVIYPHISAAYGREGDPRAGLAFLDAPLRVLAYGVPLAALASDLVFPALLERFFPRYLPCVPASRVLLLATLPFAIHTYLGAYLTALERQNAAVTRQAASAALQAAAMWAAAKGGLGLLGVAAATVLGRCLFAGLLLRETARLHGLGGRELARRAAAYAGPGAALALGSVLLESALSRGGHAPWLQGAARGLLLGVPFAAAAAAAGFGRDLRRLLGRPA